MSLNNAFVPSDVCTGYPDGYSLGNEDNFMYIMIKKKPPLTLELDDKELRDGVLDGFKYIILNRLEERRVKVPDKISSKASSASTTNISKLLFRYIIYCFSVLLYIFSNICLLVAPLTRKTQAYSRVLGVLEY